LRGDDVVNRREAPQIATNSSNRSSNDRGLHRQSHEGSSIGLEYTITIAFPKQCASQC
jgi:hypothetical protein